MNNITKQDIEKYTYIDCSCGQHALKVTCWLTYHGHNNELYNQEWGLSFFKNEAVNKPSIWSRFKIAWKVITRGTMHDDQLLITEEEAEKLEQFIRNNNYAECIINE